MSAPLRPDDADRFKGPWFDARTAAAYVCCKTVKAWYEWRKRHGIVQRANHSVAKADLDRALQVRAAPRRGGSVGNPRSLANLERAPKRMARMTAPPPPAEVERA